MNGQYNCTGAKSMPVSCCTSMSSHNKELVEHFRRMVLSGGRPNQVTPSSGAVVPSVMARGQYNKNNHAHPGQQYNFGVMLNECEFELCCFWSCVPHIMKMP